MLTSKVIDSRKLAMLALVLATSLTFAACTPTGNSAANTPSAIPGSPTDEKAPAAGALLPGNEEKAPNDVKEDAQASSASGEMGVVDPKTKERTVTIEAGSFYFKPAVVRVKKGEKVKIVLNSVSMMHDYNVDELKIKVPVTKNGSSSTIEFTAPMTAGTFESYCSVGNHRAQGQVGTLIVE